MVSAWLGRGRPEWSQWANREIARLCGVDDTFVGKMRERISSAAKPQKRKVKRNGKEFLQDVSSRGKNQTATPNPEYVQLVGQVKQLMIVFKNDKNGSQPETVALMKEVGGKLVSYNPITLKIAA